MVWIPPLHTTQYVFSGPTTKRAIQLNKAFLFIEEWGKGATFNLTIQNIFLLGICTTIRLKERKK